MEFITWTELFAIIWSISYVSTNHALTSTQQPGLTTNSQFSTDISNSENRTSTSADLVSHVQLTTPVTYGGNAAGGSGTSASGTTDLPQSTLPPEEVVTTPVIDGNGTTNMPPSTLPLVPEEALTTPVIGGNTGGNRTSGNHGIGGKIPLYIGGFFSLGGFWDASGILPAAEMGLDHINNRTDILDEYELRMIWNDTECRPTLGNRMFIDQLFKSPTKLALLGPPCSTSAQIVAGTSHYWNLLTISYSAESPHLSNRENFPYFYRTNTIGTSSNPSIVSLMREFGWTRLATIQRSDETFVLAIEDLVSRVTAANFTIVASETVASEPEVHVTNIKNQDGKIIYVYMFADEARKVFCEAYKQDMTTPEYVWIIPGWYSAEWATQVVDDEETECTREELYEALQSTTILTTEQLTSTSDNTQTISGYSAAELESQLLDRLEDVGYVWNDYAPFAYDATWSIGLMLHKCARKLEEKEFSDGSKRRLEEFTYEDRELFEFCASMLNDTNFIGMSGQITFRGGDRWADSSIRQQLGQNYTQIHVATYFILNDSLVRKEGIEWKGGFVPMDQTMILERHLEVSRGAYTFTTILALMGIVTAAIFLVFNIRYREKGIVKLSSPSLNNLIIIGSILVYISVPIAGLDNATACQFRVWFLSTGFVLSFGSMFSKTWRVYRVAALKTPVRRVITDRDLFIMVFVFLCIDVVLLLLWQSIDPMYLMTLEVGEEESETGMNRIVSFSHHCSSNYFTYWLIFIYIYKGLLLIFGTFLAWETRKVTIPALNDSKQVGTCVYNTVVLCIVGVSVSYLIYYNTSTLFIFSSCITIFCATFSLLVLFIPKMKLLYEHPDGVVQTKTVTNSLGNDLNGSVDIDKNSSVDIGLSLITGKKLSVSSVNPGYVQDERRPSAESRSKRQANEKKAIAPDMIAKDSPVQIVIDDYSEKNVSSSRDVSNNAKQGEAVVTENSGANRDGVPGDQSRVVTNKSADIEDKSADDENKSADIKNKSAAVEESGESGNKRSDQDAVSTEATVAENTDTNGTNASDEDEVATDHGKKDTAAPLSNGSADENRHETVVDVEENDGSSS